MTEDLEKRVAELEAFVRALLSEPFFRIQNLQGERLGYPSLVDAEARDRALKEIATQEEAARRRAEGKDD